MNINIKEIIRLSNISKEYTIGDEKVYALRNVSLSIKEGEFVSIIGPSGSGKSTLMNIIGILDHSYVGEYYLNNQLISSYSENQLANIRSRQIGFIFQNFNLIGNLTARENVELPLIYQQVAKNERSQRVDEALERVGIGHRANHKPSELSGGQQQRVAIARALVARPSLYLADEPTGNLDSATGKEIMDIFHSLHRCGSTIILITHDSKVADQAYRKIQIYDGNVAELEVMPC